MTESIHLHIGLGRIGLGLVLGLLRPGLPVVIAQRYSDRWKPIINYSHVKLLNNVGYHEYATVKYINQDTPLNVNEIQTLVGVGPVLILYDEFITEKKDKSGLVALNELVPYIGSVTTSIKEDGQKQVAYWLESINPTRDLQVYPFENTLVNELSKFSKPTERRSIIKVKRTIPDRICPEPEIKHSKSEASVEITVEEYAHVVIDSDIENCEQVFGKSDNNKIGDKILVALSPEVYEYYHLKKRRLVNGIHYFLALLSYVSLIKNKIPKNKWEAQYMPYLLSVILNHGEIERQVINTLISGQAMRCVEDAIKLTRNQNEDQKEQIFNGCNKAQLFLKLIDYGNRSLERFLHSTDLVNRVLDYDEIKSNSAKFTEHIREMHTFFNTKHIQLETFPYHYRPWIQDVDRALTYIEDTERSLLSYRQGSTKRQRGSTKRRRS